MLIPHCAPNDRPSPDTASAHLQTDSVATRLQSPSATFLLPPGFKYFCSTPLARSSEACVARSRAFFTPRASTGHSANNTPETAWIVRRAT